MQEGISIPFKIAGIPDEYTVTGKQLEIFKSYGLTAEGLSDSAIRLVEHI
jgi:transketolase